eukprot:TRINITY_DN7017_c0_g1_i1.p1 TRINITY_DN7017_c0_g1~~TRINITY_DN7017_c0_g1_i1.p1  ORF type:complete len:139 (+),score=17.17 TRINITY_DN7017_c0_g1_i1:305-721(+)
MQVAAGICAPLFAGFNTRDHPTVHLIAAILFFILAIAGQTIMTSILYKARNNDAFFAASVKPKMVVMAVAWLSFIIYIPIGLPLAESEYRMETGLYDYSMDKRTNHMRTATQWITVACLLTYTALWYNDFKNAIKYNA